MRNRIARFLLLLGTVSCVAWSPRGGVDPNAVYALQFPASAGSPTDTASSMRSMFEPPTR